MPVEIYPRTMYKFLGTTDPLLCCQFTGMFAMSFEDDNGNRLSIPGEITITFPSGGESTDVTGVQVWTMNANTGWFYNHEQYKYIQKTQERPNKRGHQRKRWSYTQHVR